MSCPRLRYQLGNSSRRGWARIVSMVTVPLTLPPVIPFQPVVFFTGGFILAALKLTILRSPYNACMTSRMSDCRRKSSENRVGPSGQSSGASSDGGSIRHGLGERLPLLPGLSGTCSSTGVLCRFFLAFPSVEIGRFSRMMGVTTRRSGDGDLFGLPRPRPAAGGRRLSRSGMLSASFLAAASSTARFSAMAAASRSVFSFSAMAAAASSFAAFAAASLLAIFACLMSSASAADFRTSASLTAAAVFRRSSALRRRSAYLWRL